MKTTRIKLTLTGMALCGSAIAADPATTDPARVQYDAERARCMSGSTGQDQASCLRSAGAAYDSVKQGRLKDPNTAYRDNALERCKTLPAADKADCESRVDGQGTGSGSVKDGGVIKETITRNVNPSNTAITNTATPR